VAFLSRHFKQFAKCYPVLAGQAYIPQRCEGFGDLRRIAQMADKLDQRRRVVAADVTGRQIFTN
jgi:hypothetical protein